jgi:hypothetical protein
MMAPARPRRPANEIAVLAVKALCSSGLMNDWNIQSRGQGCEACRRLFADRETYHTILFEERAELRRSDICSACWEKQYKEARERKGFISCWQGVYEAPPPPDEAIRKETAETLLRKLIELNDPQFIPAGYILAVMLERKRILKVKEQLTRDGHRVFVYEQPKTGDVFTITDPNLRLDQLEQVQHDVAALLEHGLTPPLAAAEASLARREEAAAAATPSPEQPAAVAETEPDQAHSPSRV